MNNNEGYVTIATNKSDMYSSFILANSLKKFDQTRRIVLFTDEFFKVPKMVKDFF